MRKLAKDLGLSDRDIDIIFNKFDRKLTDTEVYIFSAQWSEHCGYRHSKELLKKEFGEIDSENAGYIKINNYAIVFKVESHNHPSAIEPFQGAATGIGGIVRDVLAMGAKPVALLDLIKFGNINDNKSRNIFEGVVSGISSYGNSIGVPTIGGQTSFDEIYKTNPIVNVMCIGITDEKKIMSSKVGFKKQRDKKYLLAYFGSKTGRDGIHGASFASKNLKGKEDRISVQIGDPFAEKNLIDATLEIVNIDGVLAIQDMGAAGLLSSSSEITYKSNCGCKLNLDKVPLREKKMEAWEILLSESQERMLLVINEKAVKKLESLAYKYYLDFSVIGELTEDKYYKVYKNGKKIADIDIDFLVNAPSKFYNVDFNEIKDSEFIKLSKQEFSENNFKNVPIFAVNKTKNNSNNYLTKFNKFSNVEILKVLLNHPDFSSSKWVYEQYDYMVQTNTVLSPGYNSSILWIKDGIKGIATNIVDNHLQNYLDPFTGSYNLVFNAARKIIAVGGFPAGVTDNLNFGNPEKKEVMYQFIQSVKGISKACKDLKIPVVSGNVSFYNETLKSIYPTPVIGMVGKIKNIKNIMTHDFKNINDRVYVVGKIDVDKNKIGGSFYLKTLYNFIGGRVDKANLELELRLYKLISLLIENKIVNSVTNISKGGLLYWIFRSLVNTNFGFEGYFGNDSIQLFGENQSRFIVSVSKDFEKIFLNFCKKFDVNAKFLGIVVPDQLILNYIDSENQFQSKTKHISNPEKVLNKKILSKEEIDLEELKKIYFNNIKEHME